MDYQRNSDTDNYNQELIFSGCVIAQRFNLKTLFNAICFIDIHHFCFFKEKVFN